MGLLHYEDLRHHADWEDDDRTPVRSLIAPVLPEMVVGPDCTINDAFDHMLLSASPRLLVYERGRFLGLVTRASVTRLRELHQKDSQWVTLTGATPRTAAHPS